MAIPPLFSPSLAKELGLAVDRANLSEEENRYWQSLENAAEDEFLESYPIFKYHELIFSFLCVACG
jgi:hypothetical protein